MLAPFRCPRLVTSRVALFMVMSTAGANAQSPDVGPRKVRVQGRFGCRAGDRTRFETIRPLRAETAATGVWNADVVQSASS